MFLSYFFKFCQRISKNDLQFCDTQKKKEEDHYLNEQIVIEQ